MTEHAGSVDIRVERDTFSLAAAFAIPAPGITGLFGRSGCGKTTLLRCIAGLEPASRGVVRVQGETWQDAGRFVPPHRRAAGYVFQEPRLFPHLSVAGNLHYGMRRAAAGSAGAVDFDHVVELLGLGHLLARRPARLSGGERQRAAIARALLRRPRIILMDEPLANLDSARKQEILPFLDRLHAEVSLPILYVSHSLDEITHLCDRLVVLDAGRVTAAGPLQDVLLRDDLPLPAGEEAGAVVEGTVREYDAEYEMTRVAVSAGELLIPGRHGRIGSHTRLRILARDVSLALSRPEATTILNILPAEIDAVHPQPGGYVAVRLRCGIDRLVARISRRSLEKLAIRPGMRVYAQLKGVAVRSVR